MAIDQMPMLTGKQARAYECSLDTYNELVEYLKIKPIPFGFKFSGVDIIIKEGIPYGKFYPAAYVGKK